MRDGLPVPRTREGRAGLAAMLEHPGRALLGLDFDGTLAPIVQNPDEARPHPASARALRRLSGVVGTLAIITGRPAAEAATLGSFAGIPGIVVLGQYGFERWQDGVLSSPPAVPAVVAARAQLPGVLTRAGAPEGTWVEDKGHALVVHARRTADPLATLELLREPLATLAASTGLAAEPGRLVIELRPAGHDKGDALLELAREHAPEAVWFVGDDLGDVAAFRAVHALRAEGHPGLTVCSASAEVAELAAQADLVVDGPEGVSALLGSLADVVGAPVP